MEVASARAQIEQEANDVFGELNKRFSQETAVMAALRGTLTQAQKEAQAEVIQLQAATQKTGQVELEARDFIAKQKADFTKEAQGVISHANA